MWAFEGARQLRDRLVSARDGGRFDALVANALRQHFDYVSDDRVKTIFSSLMGGATDRVAASHNKGAALVAIRRAERFTASPINVYSQRDSHPMIPLKTRPEVTPASHTRSRCFIFDSIVSEQSTPRTASWTPEATHSRPFPRRRSPIM